MQYLGKIAIWILLASINHFSRTKSEVTIFPENLIVLEGSNGTVRCTYNGNIDLKGANFVFNGTTVASISVQNCTFNLLNLSNYRTACEDKRTITLTMVNISRNYHGKRVQCKIILSNIPEESENQSVVYVDVPVKNISITSPSIEDRVLSVCENVNISLHCTTSAARPAANISWVYQSRFPIGDITDLIANSKTSVNIEADLFVTSSKLYIEANKLLNNWFIFCSSSNVPDVEINSSSISFDILYPPYKSPTILNGNITNGDTYRIIEGRQGELTCAVPLSNPNANLTWMDLEQSYNTAGNLNYVSTSLEWVASRHDKDNFTCTVQHNCLNVTKSISVKIKVLYKPTIKPMKDVSIVEGSLLNITCDITLGIPEAVTINWTRQTDIFITNLETLTIQNISRDSSTIYTCHVANIMKPTIGPEESGGNSSSFKINVLYPPTIDSIKNQLVTEGSDFNLSCPINPGNPNTTNITWTSTDRRIQRATQFLSFKNISRNQAAIYTCTASNIMNPTNNIKVEGHDSESFHLVVEYRTTIQQFFINGYNSASNVTLNEHDNVMFHCNVDSLPTSTTDIKFQNGSILKSTNSTNNVSYLLGPATCLDAGIYECSGRNKHNSVQEDVKMQLILFVNCSPRAHPKIQVKSNITTALNVPLVLSFTAVAYPLPITVTWQKFNGFNWTIIMSYNDTSIRNSNLIFNLTFQNVQHEDIGKYKLVIINENDNFEQNFTIIPADQDEYKENQGGSILGIVLGVVSGLSGVIVAVVLVIWFLRKRHQKAPAKSIYQNMPFVGKAVKSNTNKKKKMAIERETNVDENVLQEVDDVPNIQTERTEYYNSLEKIEQIDRINVSELFQYVIGKDIDEFAIEYQKIPTELQKPCIFARKPENIALNRYNGIFPYDHSRVKIPELPDFFMNACYIDGFQKDKAYIASLGPTEKTTHNYVSFWQMVWHEKSDVIVMLTNLREISGMKCEQYWPNSGSITYGEISVSCLKTEIFAEYTVRTFRLSKDKEHQTVAHLHYTAWPDKTVPEDVTSLLEFRQRMIATTTTSQGPTIVHCSAGIGRTGTLIAVDRLVAEGRAKKSVDVFECVRNMREQRVKMVQTLEQYIFVYKALAYALSFDCEAMSIKDFPKHVDATHSSKYSRQFQQLRQTVEKDKKEENEARNRNEKQTNKNRPGADIPGDRFRVFLNLDKEDDSNYINAVYINSFKTKDVFIIGQTPLRSTVKDFISMAYQENCICIVTMDDLNGSEKTVGRYISDNKQKTYGNFNISTSILETKHQYILREMKMKYEGKYQRGEKRVYHFQYTKWLQENQTPEKAEDFVRFVKEVHQYANELGNETSHILVHCLNAYERSGLFCAVSVIMEKLQLEDRVSVTNTVRHLRTRRRSVINSKEQLLFCYQAAGAFIQLQGN